MEPVEEKVQWKNVTAKGIIDQKNIIAAKGQMIQ
jgi:hypothetical protein